ncbi:BolA-like protein, partial [Oesophagostomum dentatum]
IVSNISIQEVTDESDGCGAKFLITVVSDAFNGKRVLECHRLVQDAIADIMPQIHAVTINAYTQSKWENAQKSAA